MGREPRGALLIGLALIVLATMATADDSDHWRADARRSGSTLEILPPAATPEGLALLWETNLPGGDIYSSPCVAGGRVYVGATDGKVYAFSAADGSLLWTYQTNRQIAATPAYYKGRLYVGSRDGRLYVLHGGTGELLFDIFHGGDQKSSPLVVNDVLYFCPGDPGHDIRAHDALDGSFLWSFDTGQVTWCSPAHSNGKIYVGNNSGHWYALDAATGAQVWTYKTYGGVYFSSPAVEGNIVIVTAGAADRYLHVLDADTGAFHKKVLAVPPPGTVDKVGGTPAGEPAVRTPETMVLPPVLEMLMGMKKADRDAYLNALAAENGINYDELIEWLDIRTGDKEPSLQKPGEGKYYINLSRPAEHSSPALFAGKAYLSARELSGVNTDEFYTVAIDVDPAVPEGSSVLWGTTPSTQTLMDATLVPSPGISTGLYVYNVHGTLLQVRQESDGTKLGEVDIGEQILGSPVPADGRVFLTGVRGKVAAYQSANLPPYLPDTYSPSGGQNVTSTNTPVLSWFGQIDPESPVDTLSTELQIGVGYANRDVELSLDPVISLGPGTSSFLMPSVPGNTHVYWRLRVRDPNGAMSPWSLTQDFWVMRDAIVPDPPENLIAIPGDGKVIVEWGASPSPDVMMYRLWWKEASQTWPEATPVNDIAGLSWTVDGLANGTAYEFMVAAVDAGENESTGVTAGAIPQPAVQILGGGSYPTIQDAIDNASPGDAVIVGPGDYIGDIVLAPGVSLQGYSPKHTKIIGSGVGTVIVVQGTHPADPMSTISDVTVENGVTGVDGGTADLLLLRVIIHDMAGTAVTADAGGRLQVIHGTLMSNGGDGVASLAETYVRNSIVGKNGNLGLDVPPSAAVDYNDVYGNTAGDLPAGVGGGGNLSEVAEFSDEASSDFTVVSGSPTVDVGDPADDFSAEPSPNGARVNLGAYGNTPWAARTIVPSGGGGGGGGGRCGSVGLELMLPLLLLVWRRKRRIG